MNNKVEKEQLDFFVNLLDEKLAYDIVALEVSKFTPFEDYFVVCTARNSRHLHSLAKEVVKSSGSKAPIEGLEEIGSEAKALWVLIDLKNIVVNICNEEGRKHYRLDSLYVDAEEVATAIAK
jgi:ribosome-associated protein